MKRIARLLEVAVLGMALLVAAQAGAAAESAEESIQARKVVEEYFAALNAGRLDAVISLYHGESVFLPKNAPAVRGIDEITKAYRNLFENIKLNTEHVYHHVSVHGDVAIVESQANGTLTILEGKKVLPANDKELFVLRKINNKWKIDRYMFNDSEKPGA